MNPLSFLTFFMIRDSSVLNEFSDWLQSWTSSSDLVESAATGAAATATAVRITINSQPYQTITKVQGDAIIIKQLWPKCRFHIVSEKYAMESPQSVHFCDIVRFFLGFSYADST